MKNKNRNGKRPTTKDDLDTLEAHLVDALAKTLDHYTTKENLKGLATKEDLKGLAGKFDKLEEKVDKIDYNVSDIRRRVIDLETIDPPTRAEFNTLKARVGHTPR